MRVGTVTDQLAASKADYEGGDYSPEEEAAGERSTLGPCRPTDDSMTRLTTTSGS